jgi:hypothetical protein
MAKTILDSYISKVLIDAKKQNDDVITVSTKYFSPAGDVYELDTRTLSPLLVQTTQSLQELKPEISEVYPYKIVTPIDFDGATLLLSPSIDTQPTASQGYYAPIYFERYNTDILVNIDKRFTELTDGTLE